VPDKLATATGTVGPPHRVTTLLRMFVLHCYIVLGSASTTVVYPIHAFMHKPCNTANFLCALYTIHWLVSGLPGVVHLLAYYVTGVYV
jgi:hypothetical protein